MEFKHSLQDPIMDDIISVPRVDAVLSLKHKPNYIDHILPSYKEIALFISNVNISGKVVSLWLTEDLQSKCHFFKPS